MKKLLIGLAVLSSVAFGCGTLEGHNENVVKLLTEYEDGKYMTKQYAYPSASVESYVLAKKYHNYALEKIAEATTIVKHMHEEHNASASAYEYLADILINEVAYAMFLDSEIK